MGVAAMQTIDAVRPWAAAIPPSTDRRRLRGYRSGADGRRAEEATAGRYERAGWRILERNWRADRLHGGGEIDIVARRGDLIVFVEVKRRGSLAAAASALSPAQRRRMVAAALRYAELSGTEGCDMRFDLAAADRSGALEIIENVTMD